jgi:four helix bundle protein
MRKEMEKRLTDFVVLLFEISQELESGYNANHLSNQIFRSSTGAALNFAESQASESRKDFIHKSSIVLKELRETNVNLKIIAGLKICKNDSLLNDALQESEELVAIFYRSVETAKKNAIE